MIGAEEACQDSYWLKYIHNTHLLSVFEAANCFNFFLFSFPGQNIEQCQSEIARVSGDTGSTHQQGYVVKRVVIVVIIVPLFYML